MISRDLVAVAIARPPKGKPDASPTIYHGWEKTLTLHHIGGCYPPGMAAKPLHRSLFQALVNEGFGVQCPHCWTMKTWFDALLSRNMRPKRRKTKFFDSRLLAVISFNISFFIRSTLE